MILYFPHEIHPLYLSLRNPGYNEENKTLSAFYRTFTKHIHIILTSKPCSTRHFLYKKSTANLLVKFFFLSTYKW